MPAPAQTFTRANLRIYANSIDIYQRQLIDHVFSHSPALAIFANQTLGDFGGVRLRGVGHTSQRGGHAVVMRARLADYSGAKRGAGPFDTHNTAVDDSNRLPEANWAFYTHGVALSAHDLRVNQGDAVIGNKLQEDTEACMLALADLVATDIYADGGPNAIAPLPVLINANDTVQGLSGATFTRYNSRGLSARGTAPAGVTFISGSFAAQGLADMRTLWNNASEGLVQPNAILTSYGTLERYEGTLQPQERFQGAVPVADGSFMALAFKSAPVLADPKCGDGDLFMVLAGTSNGIQLVALSGADFQFDPEGFKRSSNQTVMVRALEATIALTIKNRQYGSNRMTGITD